MRIAALLLTVLTGATGLVYEVTWQKYLSTLLGSHSEATAAVLGIFLAGLSLGYVLFGRLTRTLVARAAASGTPPKLLWTYGLVEAGIGVYALLFPLLFVLVQRFSFLVPHGAAGLGFAFDVVLAAVLLLPPTILMGGTIPILTQALSRSLEDATRFHAFVYAFNTAGAVFGALSASFVFVPWLGLRWTLFAMGVVNIVVGAVFLALAGRARAPALAAAPGESASTTSRPDGFAVFIAVALLIGFSMMALQTVLIRIAGLSFGSSQFTFSTVVAVFVLCIAIGSFAVSLLPRIPNGLLIATLGLLILFLYLLHPILGVGPFWAHVLRTVFSSNNLAFYPYYLAGFLALLALIGPAVVLSGAALPLLFHHLRNREGDLGAMAGALYGWNTVGSLLGALLGGYVLLFWVDLDDVYRIAVGGLAVATVFLLVRLYGVSLAVGATVLAGVLGALLMLRDWDPHQLSIGLFRNRELLKLERYDPQTVMEDHYRDLEMKFYEDDPIASISVLGKQDGAKQVLSIINNGKSDGATGADYPTMGLISILPALILDRFESAFVIGYGTGVTVGEAAALDSTRRVVVAEISPGVVEAAPLFDPYNQNASKNPKVEILRSDAYRALLRSKERFDAILSEPSNPWVTGIEMLYSREFLEAARSRLEPGGVYVQWFHQYETDAETVDLVLRTYLSVFDDVAVWYGVGPDLLVLGFAEPHAGIALGRIEQRTQRPDITAGLLRCGIQSVAGLLTHELLPTGVLAATGLEGPIHTLYHPRLSHAAGRAFFMGGTGTLPFTGFGEPARIGAQRSLLRQFLSRFDGDPPEEVFIAMGQEACRHRSDRCAALLAAWGLHHPDSTELAEAVAGVQARGTLTGPIPPELVVGLRELLAGAPEETGELPPVAGERATMRFRHYYDHAFAFDPDRLRAIWARCHAPGDACAYGSQQAELLLSGGLREDRGQSFAGGSASVAPSR